jgi:hypothetical protein
MKINPPLSSTTFINRFEGSFGTFGEGKKNSLYIRSICSKKNKNKK